MSEQPTFLNGTPVPTPEEQDAMSAAWYAENEARILAARPSPEKDAMAEVVRVRMRDLTDAIIHAQALVINAVLTTIAAGGDPKAAVFDRPGNLATGMQVEPAIRAMKALPLPVRDDPRLVEQRNDLSDQATALLNLHAEIDKDGAVTLLGVLGLLP